MTEKDISIFTHELLNTFDILGERGKVLSERAIDIYFDTLREYPIDLVINGIKQCNKTCKFFPRPADIIEKIDGTEDEIIDQAFILTKKTLDKIGYHNSIMFKDKKIAHTINDMGGLQEAHDKIFRDKKDSAYFDFKRSYKRYLKMEREGIELDSIKCIGYTESLGGIYKLAIVDGKDNKVMQITPSEWKPYLLGNKEAFKQIESKTTPQIEKKVIGNTVQEIIGNIGFKKI